MDLKSNQVAVPQKDHRLRGAAAPQGLSLSWGTKHIRESIPYLYSNPGTFYSQLMVTAHNVVNENEEVQDKVQAKSAVTTEPVEGATELGNQIARLMAALTRTGQGNSPSRNPNSPRHRGHGRGRTDRSTLVTPIPIMAKLVWDRPPQPTAYLLAVEQGPQVKAKGMPKDPKMVRAVF